MKKAITIILIIFFQYSFSQNLELNHENRIIVKFKPNIEYNLNSNNNTFGIQVLDELNLEKNLLAVVLSGNKKKADTYLLIFEFAQNMPELISDYLRTDLFEYVESDHIGKGGGEMAILPTLPNDSFFSRQYGLLNDGSFTLAPSTPDADIDMELAWDIEQGDSSIIVAVLDSGIKLDHPEFAGRIWTNTNEIANGIDDDNNGYIDDLEGWDFANDDNDPSDDHGHGTNVTGIMGLNSNNNEGYAGVDWNCKIMAGKVLDNNNAGFYSWMIDGIYYAVDNGANVINMSLGGPTFSQALEDAVNYAYNNNVTIVTCMMNFDNISNYYPAAYQNTIAVGSTDPDDERSSPFFWNTSSGSNFGPHIDVVAPGNYIYGLSYQSNSNYNTYWGGTSQATPLVAGLASLLLAQDPTRTPDDIRNIIRITAEDQTGNPVEDTQGFDIFYGYGRINAYEALLEGTLSTITPKIFDFSISPNPTTDVVTVNSNVGFDSVIIYNILGAQLSKIDNFSKPLVLEIDLSSLASGTYLMSFISKSKIITTKKIIKK